MSPDELERLIGKPARRDQGLRDWAWVAFVGLLVVALTAGVVAVLTAWLYDYI